MTSAIYNIIISSSDKHVQLDKPELNTLDEVNVIVTVSNMSLYYHQHLIVSYVKWMVIGLYLYKIAM